jgi:hypothetical protein
MEGPELIPTFLPPYREFVTTKNATGGAPPRVTKVVIVIIMVEY